MRIIFMLINMNLGGTEKSFLNLLDNLSGRYEIDLYLLERKGELLSKVPEYVQTYEMPNASLINDYLRLGPRIFGMQILKQGKVLLFIRCMLQFLLTKYALIDNPYWAINKYLCTLNRQYDFAVSYAGIHDFIAYFIVNKTKAKKKYQWIHFDVDNVITNKSFGNRFYAQFDKIFCVSENAKTSFVTMFPQLAVRTEIFENIISHNLVKQQAEVGIGFDDNFNGLRLVTLGRFSREKGQQMIPEVVTKLKQLNIPFRWYLIGDGKLRNELEQSIHNLGIEEELVLLGSAINPYKYLQDCDIYVQTSLHEGYCITVHEAKVFNKPVVTTNFLSASNLILNQEDGLIVDISVDGLYEGVKKMIVDDDFRSLCSRALLVKDTSSEVEKLFFEENDIL